MNFLVDAQLPPKLCEWLEEWGHRARHVSHVGMVGAPDSAIADLAEREALVLVTKDEDFLYLRLPRRFAVVWLRIGNATNRALEQWLSPRWSAVIRALSSGEMLVEVR